MGEPGEDRLTRQQVEIMAGMAKRDPGKPGTSGWIAAIEVQRLAKEVFLSWAERDEAHEQWDAERGLRIAQDAEAAKLKADMVTLAANLHARELDGYRERESHIRELTAEVSTLKAEREEWADDYRKLLDARLAQHADLSAANERVRELVECLEKIRDTPEAEGVGQCLCEHDTENCCAKVGYPCHYCIAQAALTPAGALLDRRRP